MSGAAAVTEIVQEASRLAFDIDFASVSEWKAAAPGRRAIGYLPVYAPREVIHAAGMLPVGIFGGGDRIEIIRGDACFQSYICHIPRSTVELALSGRLACLDGMVFPSTCDVIRNLSGMWRLLLPGVFARYLEVPHNFDPEIGGRFFRRELAALGAELSTLAGGPGRLDEDALREAIRIHNENRRLVRAMNDVRRASPHLAPASETAVLLRAGCAVPVERHNALLRAYVEAAADSGRPAVDNCRVVVRGAFCEQPPLALLRTLERAGCDIVDDDLALGLRWLREDVSETGDPWEALALAWIRHAEATACRYIGEQVKGAELVESVRACGAEGVILAAPSFCDPALLDQPMLTAALDASGVPWTAFKYAEDTGQFQPIREQAGTFSDSIKLWSAP